MIVSMESQLRSLGHCFARTIQEARVQFKQIRPRVTGALVILTNDELMHLELLGYWRCLKAAHIAASIQEEPIWI